MSYQPTPIRLKPAQRTTLESWIRSTTAEQRLVFRSKIIMMANEAMGTNAIARKLETRPATVTKWRTRFARLGLDGLRDAPRPGQRRRYLPDDEKRVLRMLDQSPPSGYSQWNGPLLARALSLPAGFVWKGVGSTGIQ